MNQGFDEVASAGASSYTQDPHISMSLDSLGKRKRNGEVETASKRERSPSPLFTIDEDAEIACDDESEPDPDEYFDDPVEVLWSEEQEPLPSLPLYHPDIKIIKEKLLSPFPQIQEILDAHKCSTDSVDAITAKMRNLNSIPGKSSTINSLLDIVGVAREGSTGHSCTFVVTEYQGPFEGQVLPFAAKLQYATIENVRSMLSELLDAYNRWESTCHEDWGLEEMEDFRMQRDTALQTFLTLFCDKQEFKSESVAKDYLEETADGMILEAMVVWCKEALKQKPPNDEGYSECVEANSAPELRVLVGPSLSANARNNGEPAFWPLLAKVTIGLLGPRVLKHMVIADLPGISDNNQVRVKATTDYIRTCDNLWIVAREDRVLTDSNVDKWIQRYSNRFRGKLAVICTRSDEISDHQQLAEDLESMGYDLVEYKEISLSSRTLGSRIRGLNVRLEALAKKRSKDLKNRFKIIEDRDNPMAQKTAVENQQFENVVKVKNHHVISFLQQEKQAQMPEGRLLEVHCISNRQYSRLKGVAITDSVHLGAEATGIPGLRAYSLGLPALAAMENLEGYMNYTHRAFLNGLLLWTEKTSVKNQRRLLDVVEAPQKELDNFFDAYMRLVEIKLDQSIKVPFATHQSLFIDHARSKVANLRQVWRWGTFKAFCLKDGKHKTSSRAQQSWNDHFLQPVLKHVGNSWDMMDMELATALRRLENSCIHGLENISWTIEAETEAQGFAMNKLRDLAEAQCEGVRSAVTMYIRDYEKENANIMLDTFRDQERSYFVEHMKPVYKDCGERKGSGSFAAAFATMDSFLALQGKASPFAMLATDAIKAVRRNARFRLRMLRKTIVSIYVDFYNQFAAMIEEDTEGGNDPDVELRKAITELLEKEMPKIEETKAQLEAIKASFRV